MVKNMVFRGFGNLLRYFITLFIWRNGTDKKESKDESSPLTESSKSPAKVSNSQTEALNSPTKTLNSPLKTSNSPLPTSNSPPAVSNSPPDASNSPPTASNSPPVTSNSPSETSNSPPEIANLPPETSKSSSTSTAEPPSNNQPPKAISPPTTSFKHKLAQWLAVLVKNLLLITTGSTNPDSLVQSFSKNPANFGEGGIFTFLTYLNMLIVPLGGVTSGIVAHFIGRKKAIHLAIIPLLACRIWTAFADGWQLCLASILTSLCSEFFKAPVLTHVAESTTPQLRGKLVASSAASMMLGSFNQLFMQTFFSPRSINIINCLLPVVCFCLIPLIPESPHWLIAHNKPEEAKKSLAWMRGWASPEEVDAEFQEMLSHHGKTSTTNADAAQEAKKVPKKSAWRQFVDHLKEFTKISFLWPLGIVAFMYFLVHCTGTTSLLAHPDGIFATLQTPINKSYVVVLLGAANSLGSSVSVSEINKYGKRVMAMASLAGIGVCSVIIATYAYVYDIKYYNATPPNGTTTIQTLADPNMEPHKWIPVIVLFLIAIISYCGISNIPTMLVGELFTKDVRSSGAGIASGITNLFSSIVTKTFIPAINLFTFPGVYWIYGGLSIFGAIILHFILPETEGKSLQDIENHFTGVSKLDNTVGGKSSPNTNKATTTNTSNSTNDVTTTPA